MNIYLIKKNFFVIKIKTFNLFFLMATQLKYNRVKSTKALIFRVKSMILYLFI